MLPNDPFARLAEQTRQRFLRLAPAREGALAVFTESPTVSLVRVRDIVASDSEATLRITLEPDAGIGFRNPEQHSADIGSPWANLDVSTLEWSSAPYSNWHLLFDPALYTSVRETIQQFAAEGRQPAYLDLLRPVQRWRQAQRK